jgi:S-disulfanyl-L-cysteine oxidoreductase SoxD
MFSCRSVVVVLMLLLAAGVDQAMAQQERFTNIGRTATPKEVAAWDIDVRPDFKGLPPGRGSVAQGQVLWEAQCAGCHGIFGESNEVFSPIVGGTTRDDVKSGRVATLREGAGYPQRTTLMKLPHLSTLWDYLYRAMPWTAPKTLKPDEVYALTAYILHLGEVLPADFTLSDANMREVQELLPNRNGMTTQHAGWPTASRAKPDVQGSECMRECAVEPTIASFIPEHARNAHGNLAQQQRLVGPQRGALTAPPAAAATPQQIATATATPVDKLLQKNLCLACHQTDAKAVGPSFREVAARHGTRADATEYLASRIRQGGAGNWGTIPMPPQPIDQAEAQAIAAWLAAGAKP